MRACVSDAAARIAPASSFLERFVDEALCEAIVSRWTDARVEVRRHLPLVGWERMPESTARRPPTKRESDLHVIPPRGSVPAILSEHKIWDLDASLFDVAKLLTFARLDGVASTYLVAGERRELFDTHKPGRALYARTDRSWHITELCHGPWKDTWMKHLLNAGVAPTSLPLDFETTFLAEAPVAGFPDHDLRCVRMEAKPNSDMVEFRHGRMLGEHPPEASDE